PQAGRRVLRRLARPRGSGDEVPGARLRRPVAVRAGAEDRPARPAVLHEGGRDRAPPRPARRLDGDAGRVPRGPADGPRGVEVPPMSAGANGRTARDGILGAIRAALRDVPAGEGPDAVPVPRDYRTDDPSPLAARVSRFVARVAEYKAAVRRVPADELPQA